MAENKSKHTKKLNGDKSSKSAESQAGIASQPTESTGTSLAPNDMENNSNLQMPAGDPSKPSARPTLESLMEQVKGYDPLPFIKRLKYRYPRDRDSREFAGQISLVLWISESIPIPTDDEVRQALGAHYLELLRIIARAGATPEEMARGKAFLREFLILACAPDRTPAPPESETV
jgi:hypothetical protein